MPFSAYLGKERANTGLSPCADLIKNQTWDNLEWEVRLEYCRTCPYRFMHQPSCSLDFLSFSDIEAFKHELSIALTWIARKNPKWNLMNGAFHEVDLAYHCLGAQGKAKETPLPKVAVLEFIDLCIEKSPDNKKPTEKFFREWNRVVEGYEGKPFKVEATEEMGEASNSIVAMWMDPRKYAGDNLYLLYSAVAILYDASVLLDLHRLQNATHQLMEACHKAMVAKATLKIA